MTNQPTHRAYVVQDAKTDEGKARWIEVGAIWPHGKGDGFDLVIPEGLSVSGRIVCVVPKAKDQVTG